MTNIGNISKLSRVDAFDLVPYYGYMDAIRFETANFTPQDLVENSVTIRIMT